MSEPTDQEKRAKRLSAQVETVVAWNLCRMPRMRDEDQAFKAACIRMGAEGMLAFAEQLITEARRTTEGDAS